MSVSSIEPSTDGVVPGDRTSRLFDLLEAADSLEDADRARAEIVTAHMGLARMVAWRYRGRGVDLADLEQVAYEALIKAVARFDRGQQESFTAYAVPTILGGIRHYFRDLAWTVKPPRRISELQSRIASVTDRLVQELGRSPRPREVAETLGCEEEDVLEALAADGAFTPTSLERPAAPEGTMTVGDWIVDDDVETERAEARLLLGHAMHVLDERDRLIVELRFFHGWSQQRIGAEIGVTQMQVSRLLTKILARLRTALQEAEETERVDADSAARVGA